ncbi:peptidyl-prolyl cis-trans isomerase [Tardiphaga robiniae]|uniref:Peptidyl-prolyl cis-trans isomerase, EpsD family n=1 Tax=Tardiphaga robiniae TaxID=943830 RepID=A0A7G6TUL3_9BRAD|nr:peptidyl-prolyl cis-trans isomerase [Tardiphaga robiniae]QND70445.1 hypothetical protein HB776_03680 [Tardiphaga robiniae]
MKSQVVAHVGDEVITTPELENEIRWSGISAAKQKDPETIRKVLGELVQRKYLVRQAVVTAKLDREPGVLLDLLRSRDVVLANAYLNRAAGARPPTKTDVDNYIADNPQKFEKRELLNVAQVVFPLSPDNQALIEAAKQSKSIDDVQAKLTAAGIQNVRQTATLLSGDLSPDLLQLIAVRRPDDVFLMRAGPNGLYFQVLQTEPRPLTGAQAAELARQALRADALKAEAGVAAFSANIEVKYQGEYGGIMGKPASTPTAAKN